MARGPSCSGATSSARCCSTAGWRSDAGDDAYTEAVTEAVYRALGVRAADVLASGSTVIADATFLAADARDAIAGVAARAGVPFTGVWLEAPVDTMAERLRARAGDASDATVDVLRGSNWRRTWGHTLASVRSPVRRRRWPRCDGRPNRAQGA